MSEREEFLFLVISQLAGPALTFRDLCVLASDYEKIIENQEKIIKKQQKALRKQTKVINEFLTLIGEN